MLPGAEEEEGPTDSRSSREGFAAELVSPSVWCAGSLLALFAFFFLFLNPVVFHGSRTAPVGVLLAVLAKRSIRGVEAFMYKNHTQRRH